MCRNNTTSLELVSCKIQIFETLYFFKPLVTWTKSPFPWILFHRNNLIPDIVSLQFLKPILVSLWRLEQFAHHYIIFTPTHSEVTQFKHAYWLNVNAHFPSSTLYTVTNQIYSGAKCLQCKLVKSLVFFTSKSTSQNAKEHLKQQKASPF